MTTRNMLAAFVVTGLLAWSQLGGVAHAQHEPVRAEPMTQASPSTTHHLRLDPDLHVVDGTPHGRGHGRGGRAGGYVLIGLGAAGIVAGGVLAVVAHLVERPVCLHNPFSDGPAPACPGHDASAWWAGTGVSAGLGILSLIVGIATVAAPRGGNDGPTVRVALAPTEGGAFGSVVIDL